MSSNKDFDSKVVNENEIEAQMSARPRSPTLINLKWLAERVRKAERIKAALAEGSYQVDTQAMAKAIVSED